MKLTPFLLFTLKTFFCPTNTSKIFTIQWTKYLYLRKMLLNLFIYFHFMFFRLFYLEYEWENLPPFVKRYFLDHIISKVQKSWYFTLAIARAIQIIRDTFLIHRPSYLPMCDFLLPILNHCFSGFECLAICNKKQETTLSVKMDLRP